MHVRHTRVYKKTIYRALQRDKKTIALSFQMNPWQKLCNVCLLVKELCF
jgi:hypothetical protein